MQLSFSFDNGILSKLVTHSLLVDGSSNYFYGGSIESRCIFQYSHEILRIPYFGKVTEVDTFVDSKRKMFQNLLSLAPVESTMKIFENGKGNNVINFN